MYKVRTTKTSSGSIAVQVVEYFHNRRQVIFHVGSAKSEEEVLKLKESAYLWIDKNDPQMSLFSSSAKQGKESNLISLDKCSYLGFRHQLLYDTLWNVLARFKFHLIDDSQILNDLVIARISEPSSKLESFKFIYDYFGIKHQRTIIYRKLRNLTKWQDEVERKVIKAAKKYFDFSFNIVFYDLTTLYFESFETDELRKIGFSKDNKASNPQIMIGLLVNNQGFPVS